MPTRLPFLAATFAAGMLLAPALPATAEIAADDPRLVGRMEEFCRAQALAAGGIDAKTAALCRCTAPVLAQHLTPEARASFVLENRAPEGPVYQDENAVLGAIVAACPEAKTP